MVLVASTEQPALVVQTKIKKTAVLAKERLGLCDTFWACVLDDYLEEVDDGTFPAEQEFESRQGVANIHPRGNKTQTKEEKKKKKRRKKTLQIREKTSEESWVGAELDTILSDDHESDLREKEIFEPLRDEKGMVTHGADLEKGFNAEPEIGPEEDISLDLQSMKQKQALRASDNGEVNPVGSPAHSDPNPDVIHYAPIEYESMPDVIGTKTSSFVQDSSRIATPHTQMMRKRVPVDPEEATPNLTVRPLRHEGKKRGSQTIRYSDASSSNKSSDVPRSPSGARTQMVRVRPPSTTSSQRSTHNRSFGRTGPLHVETIDLTMATVKEIDPDEWSPDTDGNPEQPRHNGPLLEEHGENWMIESKRRENDYRRRKLDRKEALHRIRAIKARLQTGDP